MPDSPSEPFLRHVTFSYTVTQYYDAQGKLVREERWQDDMEVDSTRPEPWDGSG